MDRAVEPASRRPSVDWGLGRYETTALKLLPAASAVLDAAALSPGERVLDVGCGTGNAALLAGRKGAIATGVDPAARLLDVAAQAAAVEGLQATFERGDAAALPVGDASADAVVSVFGVIFAPEPRAAAAELARVTASGGRIVLSAWRPEGAIADMARVSREAVSRALGVPPAPPAFAWHEPDQLGELFGPHGFEVTISEAQLGFTARSPEDYVRSETADHPMAIAGRRVLEPRGESGPLFERLLAIFEAANEDPDAFRVTSQYVIASLRRS